MAASLLLIAVVIAIVVISARNAARRRQRLMDQIARAMPSAGQAGPTDLGQAVARAVQDALTRQGLAPGSVSVTTSVGEVESVPAASGALATGNLGIGDVMSVSSITGARVATVELDAIGAPRRRVSVDLPDGAAIARGDRVYVRLDPARPDSAVLAPELVPPATRNRLDPLVLQPMLLAWGEAAEAVVKAANPADLGAMPAGASAWRLTLEVSPRSGFPFRAEVVTAVNAPAKAARLCHPGAAVTVRFDPNDTKTVMIDTAAMGLASPEPVASTAPTGINIDWSSLAGLSRVEQVKAVRQRTGLDLARAKAIVDAMHGPAGDATAQMVAMLSGRAAS